MPTKIFVRGLDGKESVYVVELTDTVRELKQKISGKEHLAVEDQRLTCRDQLLLDSKTLSQHGVFAGTSICVEREPNQPMTIQVRVDAGSHAYEVRPKDTIGRLKEMIQSRDGIPVDEQRIAYSGQILQDNKTLIECEIQKGTAIFVNRIRSTVKIHVRDEENGKLKTYEVKPTSTVRELKEKIQTQEGIPINEQRLTNCREPMHDDDQTLADYKVERYATLTLTREVGRTDDHKIQIFVKALNGKSHALEVEPTATVRELKGKIYDQLGLAIKDQRLIHLGKQLEDQHTMEHYGIRKGVPVFLILRMKGAATSS